MNLGLPVRRPIAPAEAAPDLRLVERRRRGPLAHLAVGVCALLFVVLFGLAVFHTVLVGAQGRLDALDERIAAEQARQQELRLAVATLESPARIVEEATGSLGMVTPDEVEWLEPVGAAPEDVDTPSADDGTDPDGTDPDGTDPDGTDPDGTDPDGAGPTTGDAR